MSQETVMTQLYLVFNCQVGSILDILTKSKQTTPLLQPEVKSDRKAPVIAIVASKGAGKTTTAILLALGLKKIGKNVFFLNLDENEKIPLLVPYDKRLDIVIMNCPAGYSDSVQSCVELRQ